MTNSITRLQAALRSMAVLLSFNIVNNFISPALWILNEPASVLSRVASLSSSPTILASFWIAASLLVLPFFIMQFFFPNFLHRRIVIQLAIYGLIAGSVIWGFMAFLSRNLDYNFVIPNFIFNSLMALAFAALMANGLNNDQLEEEKIKKAAL